jgi:hypothetical protein
MSVSRVLGLTCCSLIGAIAPGVVSPVVALVTPPSAPALPQPVSVPLAQGQAGPSLPPLPETIPEAIAPAESGIVGLLPAADADIGIGHLRPRDLSFLDSEDWASSPSLDANWLQSVALPIYAEPGGEPWGWLVNGWLIPNGGEPLAIGRDAAFLMLHTYYALFSFPVMELREDGWFRFQYTPAGTAWAHRDHLGVGDLDLTLEVWEDRFLETGWVEFRNHGVSQPLRPSPSGDTSIDTLIGPESFIEPLAFDGDWMQVRVTQPTDGCTFLPGARSLEGWMRWRSQEDGASLVWYPPKGC